MQEKITGVMLGAFLFALCFSAEVQQAKKIPRIGYVSGGNAKSPATDAFRQGLREIGYMEGENILVEYRYLEGKPDRVPSFVAELLQLKVDVFVSPNLAACSSAKQGA